MQLTPRPCSKLPRAVLLLVAMGLNKTHNLPARKQQAFDVRMRHMPPSNPRVEHYGIAVDQTRQRRMPNNQI